MLGEHRTSKETSKVDSSSTTVVDSTVPSTTAFNTTNYHRRTYRVQTPIFNPLKILMTFFSLEVLCVLYLTGSVLIFLKKKAFSTSICTHLRMVSSMSCRSYIDVTLLVPSSSRKHNRQTFSKSMTTEDILSENSRPLPF